MACITYIAQPLAMATTQLARAVHYQDAPTFALEYNVARNPLSMSWVVVTDKNTNRRLQVRWTPSADPR